MPSNTNRTPDPVDEASRESFPASDAPAWPTTHAELIPPTKDEEPDVTPSAPNDGAAPRRGVDSPGNAAVGRPLG